jgi:hypothetical protein
LEWHLKRHKEFKQWKLKIKKRGGKPCRFAGTVSIDISKAYKERERVDLFSLLTSMWAWGTTTKQNRIQYIQWYPKCVDYKCLSCTDPSASRFNTEYPVLTLSAEIWLHTTALTKWMPKTNLDHKHQDNWKHQSNNQSFIFGALRNPGVLLNFVNCTITLASAFNLILLSIHDQ